MNCDNCGDSATNKPGTIIMFLPNKNIRQFSGSQYSRLLTANDGDFLCKPCYDWVLSLDNPD